MATVFWDEKGVLDILWIYCLERQQWTLAAILKLWSPNACFHQVHPKKVQSVTPPWQCQATHKCEQ